MKRLSHILLAGLLASALYGDAGVLIPSGQEQPDPAVFSLNEMSIDVFVDNGLARVRIHQIFGNHSTTVQEGVYHFALPSNATISDFAVWDDVVRIPGVILERKRAEEIYNRARAQSIDPGLLEMGEREASEASRNSEFTAKIVPIPSFGTKRLELEYQEKLPVEHFESLLAIPLRPDAYGAQTAQNLSITLELHDEHAIKELAAVSKIYPLKISERTPNSIKATFFGSNVTFNEDFAIRYTLDAAQADTLRVITEREGNDGFFGVSALLGMGAQQNAAAPPRTVVALFDNSLSMQWEKLERSYQACETLLRRLRPADSFNLILFNSQTAAFSPSLQSATPDNVTKALIFIRNSRIRGGTDVQLALKQALAMTAKGGNETYFVLLTDGGSTEGLVNNGKLSSWYATEWKKVPTAARPHTFVFGIGDDANLPLLKALAGNDGVFDWVRSTEPIDFKLNAFLGKIGLQPVQNLTLNANPASNFDLVYPLEDVRFAGSIASWAGLYRAASQSASFEVTGVRNGQPFRMTATAPLPAQAANHPYLPRTWAKARVDALLEKIEREGEDRDTIDEIIRLSKKYKFVTPYTSFLAVPRALLRPRVIRPGDPVLRVHTDQSIVSVVALFPFGLVKPLRYLKGEGAWQTRFLAPTTMDDGAYQVRLILRDSTGHVYRESKSFIIASKPPSVRVKLDQNRVQRGATVKVLANATGMARTVVARLYGAEPVSLHWDSRSKASTGIIMVPDYLPAGRYTVNVTAEDVAHNIGAQEVSLEVY